MAKLSFDPQPFTEAADLIRNKPAVVREVFDRMIPEIKARSFTIAGVAVADVLQEARNRIAEVPEGADWNKVKKDVLSKISPWLVTATDPEERAKQEAAALRRAELLVRTHAFQAYQAAHWQALMETRAALPYWRYVTAGDVNVRQSHAALDGLVLPADSPFWRDHFPPWDWGCRCTVVGLSPEDVEEIRAADAKRNPEDRLVLDGARLKRLEENGQLTRGLVELIDPNDPERTRPLLDKNGSPVVLPAKTWDVASPAKSGLKNAWSWTPGDLRIPLDALRERYDSTVWAEFEGFARSQRLDAENTVWDWLGGARLLPATAPVVAPQVAADTSAAALARLGLDKKTAWTNDDIRALWNEMKEDNPVAVAEVVESVVGAPKSGPFAEKRIRSIVADFSARLPPDLARSLGRLNIVLSSGGRGLLGSYSTATHTLRLFPRAHKGAAASREALSRQTLYHELMHWVHDHGPAEYREAIRGLYRARTAGEAAERIPGYTNPIRKDKWWWEYAGTEYTWEPGGAAGLEVATTHVQLFARPDLMETRMLLPNGETIAENLKTILRVFWGEK